MAAASKLRAFAGDHHGRKTELRRARDLLDRATRGAVRFPRQVIGLFTEAIHWRNATPRGLLTVDQLELQREAFDDRLLELVRRSRADSAASGSASHFS